MKILVTGAAGFIGTYLFIELAHAGHSVYATDIKTDGHDLRIAVHVDDILDFARPDVVVHLAAKVGRLFGEDDLRETIIDNGAMTALVARKTAELGARFVYASTSEIYGDNAERECDEATGPFSLPHNLYGLSKRWGEEVAQLYAPLGLTLLRLSMPYGPGLPPGFGRAAIVNMLDQARKREEIPVHRGAERSWCWIGDTVRGIRLVIEQTSGGAFNVGRDDAATTMHEVACKACDLTGAPYSLIREIDPPERQTVVKRLATWRLRGLGWKPEVDLLEGMTRTLEWLEHSTY